MWAGAYLLSYLLIINILIYPLIVFRLSSWLQLSQGMLLFNHSIRTSIILLKGLISPLLIGTSFIIDNLVNLIIEFVVFLFKFYYD